MRNCDYCKEFQGFVFRHARSSDEDAYYRDGFLHPDPEAMELTGSGTFAEAEVREYFRKNLTRDDRADFLLIAPDGRIAGECVLNEFDPEVKSCNFRICLFSPEFRDRGLGTEAVRHTLDYAFSLWGLHRVSLEVFSFNPRAEAVYRKAGFVREGVLRQVVRHGDGYGDIILMSILSHEW